MDKLRLSELCSECDPEIGKWHGMFPKVLAAGMLIGNDGFLYASEEGHKQLKRELMKKQTSKKAPKKPLNKGDVMRRRLIEAEVSIFDKLDLKEIGMTKLTKADLLRVIETINDIAIESMNNWDVDYLAVLREVVSQCEENTVEKLKPCPFCGREDVKIYQRSDRSWVVRCSHCGANIPDLVERECSILWNTRVLASLNDVPYERKEKTSAQVS